MCAAARLRINMIRISSLKLNPSHSKDDLTGAVSRKLRLNECDIKELKIVKKSLDARDKSNIFWNYIVDIETENEEKILREFKNDRNICRAGKKEYVLPAQGKEPLKERPCIIGSGPAGLFCAYFLARYGYRPVLIEQGQCVEERIKTAEKFWKEGCLNPRSNVQFGEGGAGTFSDGKLTSGVKDTAGRKRLVLETFVENGAPEEILYLNKPHIGTDILSEVVSSMRNKIISWKGEVLFNTRFIDLAARDNELISIALECDDKIFIRPCTALVLAPGHSCRETFYMLKDLGLNIEAKAFAVGVRCEHPQEEINRAMYGENYRLLYKDALPPADYKLTYKAKDGRGVYSFCMCPGGYVVNSSSEEGALCINGMSYSKRDSGVANSAIVVSVSPEDTNSLEDPMNGIRFQEMIERAAFKETGGLIASQRLCDFKSGTLSKDPDGPVFSRTKGRARSADLNKILPDFISSDIKEAFGGFAHKIKGFDNDNVIVSAPETRTSCPVRILRDEHFESNIKGIFPAGEGAGYSGGITSSAIDGIKIFEEIFRRFGTRQL